MNNTEKQMLDRLVRIETRLVSMASRLGVDLLPNTEMQVVPESSSVYVASLGVTLDGIVNACKLQAPDKHDWWVRVCYNGAEMGRVYIP
jgi:hypothetical protein